MVLDLVAFTFRLSQLKSILNFITFCTIGLFYIDFVTHLISTKSVTWYIFYTPKNYKQNRRTWFLFSFFQRFWLYEPECNFRQLRHRFWSFCTKLLLAIILWYEFLVIKIMSTVCLKLVVDFLESWRVITASYCEQFLENKIQFYKERLEKYTLAFVIMIRRQFAQQNLSRISCVTSNGIFYLIIHIAQF